MKLAHAARATESLGDSPSDASLVDGAKKVQYVSIYIYTLFRISNNKNRFCLGYEISN
jgi:hypothetical protein